MAKEPSRLRITFAEITLDLLDIGEFRLPIPSDTILRYSSVSDEQIKGSVIIERPEFTFLLSLRRKQPLIHYRDDSN